MYKVLNHFSNSPSIKYIFADGSLSFYAMSIQSSSPFAIVTEAEGCHCEEGTSINTQKSRTFQMGISSHPDKMFINFNGKLEIIHLPRIGHLGYSFCNAFGMQNVSEHSSST